MHEIDCPECGGEYRKVRFPVESDHALYGTKVITYCKVCKDGKIQVYTEAEMQKAIADEREACAVECDDFKDIAQAQIGLIVPVAFWNGRMKASTDCAEAIRSRGDKI